MFLTKKENIDYLVVFFVIYLSSSFVGISLNGSLNIILTILIVVLYCLMNINKIKMNYMNVILFLFIITSTLMTHLLNNDTTYNYLIFWVYLLCAFLVTITLDLKRFIKVYTDIIIFIALFSLVSFLILILTPSLLNIFPYYTNSSGIQVHNLFFSVVRNSEYFNSNYGLFWEPGAYQTFLNITLFFLLFYFEKTSKFKLFIVLLTILTTVSTTGYIASGLLILIYMLTKIPIKGNGKSRNIKFILCTMLLISMISFNKMPEVVKFKLFGKLAAITDPSLLNQTSYESTLARTNSISVPIDSFLENPFFGAGFEKLINSAEVSGSLFLTATPLNWLGLFGLGIGITFLYLSWKWTIIFSSSYIVRFISLFFILTIMFSENYNRNTFILMFLLFGIKITEIRGDNVVSSSDK